MASSNLFLTLCPQFGTSATTSVPSIERHGDLAGQRAPSATSPRDDSIVRLVLKGLISHWSADTLTPQVASPFFIPSLSISPLFFFHVFYFQPTSVEPGARFTLNAEYPRRNPFSNTRSRIMSFKSLIIFALVASLGQVMAVPLGTRDSCQGISCYWSIRGNGHLDLSRRLAQFEGDNATLSSTPPTDPTPSNLSGTDPSSTLAVNPSSPLSLDPSSVGPFINPSSTSSVDPLSPSSTPSVNPLDPSSTLSVNPSSSPSDNGVVTVTVVSTIVSTVTPNPSQTPPPPEGVLSSSPANPSSTLSGDLSSSTPSGTTPESTATPPSLVQPTGFFSSPAAPPSPTVIDLNGPDSSPSSDPAGEPAPTPGIIFLPPA